MRKNLIAIFSATALILLSSCSGKLGNLTASCFDVTPKPMETVGNDVPVTISGKFPEKFMKRNAVVTVIPELRYGNGQAVQAQGATFQGEKVRGNDQTVSYRLGGRYTMKTTFTYQPEMLKSDLYMTFNARVGNKHVTIPAVKVDYGIIATSQLYKQTIEHDGGIIAPDTFQRIQTQRQDANVKFLINQATLRQSELQNNSVQEFVRLLKRINADRGQSLNVKNVEIAAYASPEGGVEYNEKLANKRQDVSENYVKQQLKQNKLDTYVDAHYTAQDWDGFKQLVQASNIQDKDVILRVLSMYKDPEEREQQIRNMSEGFRELADGILPELRRSRLSINYEVVGRTDEEIQQQYAADPAKLSIEELLYAAKLETDATKKEQIYRTTAKLHDKDYRALCNLGVLALNQGNEVVAKDYFTQALRVNNKAPEVYANYALMALKDGDMGEAENNLGKAIGGSGYNQVAGILNIAKGNYAQAEDDMKGLKTNSAALAQLLNKNYEGALETLDNVPAASYITTYLHALVAARRGNKFAANSYLQEALQQNPSLKTYTDNDLELQILK